MSSWKFEIYLDDAWVDLTNYGGRSLVSREGIDFDGQQHNDGRSVVNTLAFALVDTPAALLAELYQKPTYQLVPLTVTRDDGQYFTGYVRPVDSYSGEALGGALERSVQIEAVDTLWRLQRTLESKYQRVEYTVDAIVRELLILGGFASGDLVFPVALTQIVANISEDADDKEVIEILDDLLYEYHHCLIANEHGEVELFDWLDDGVSEPVGTLQETIGREDHEKTDEDYGYATVSYLQYARLESLKDYIGLHESKPPVLQNIPANTKRTARLDLLEKLPDGSEIIGYEDLTMDIWAYLAPSTVSYSTDRTSRLIVDGTFHTVRLSRTPTQPYLYGTAKATVDLEDGALDLELLISLFFWYLPPDAGLWGDYPLVEFTGDMDIVFVQVWGTVIYKKRAGEVKEETIAVGERTARREEYDAEYLFARADAQSLASAIIQLRQYGSRRWTRRSGTYIPLGSVVTVDSATLGLTSRGRILRLVDSQSNATDDGLQEYVYTIETLETAASTNESGEESTPTLPAFPASPIGMSDRPTFGDIENGVGNGGVIAEIPTPSVSVTSSLRKISITVLLSSSIVAATLRFDIQISKNQFDWYSLGPGGNGADDWKTGGVDSWTTVETSHHAHDSLPLGGTAASPTPTIYYYRARVRTSAAISEWSTAEPIDAAPVIVNDLQAGSVTTEKLFAGSVTTDKLSAGAVTAEKIDVADLTAIGATIAGWTINPSRLSSPGDKLRMDSEQVRTEVRDALGNIKIAIGYLEGIASYTAQQYGIYIAAGNVLQIAGGGGFENGDYIIERDAAFVLDSGTEELIRLGSLDNGDLGLKIGDIDTGNGLFFSVEKGLTVRGKIVVQDIVIDDVDGISGLSADRQRRLEISSEKIDFYEVQDGVENKTASISDREDTRPVRFTKHIRVGNLAGELPVGTVAYYSCNGGVPIGAREGGEIDFTDERAQIDGYAVSGARITNDMIVIGG